MPDRSEVSDCQVRVPEMGEGLPEPWSNDRPPRELYLAEKLFWPEEMVEASPFSQGAHVLRRELPLTRVV